MTGQLFRLRDDFEPTLRAAAERLTIPPIAVEKDYWISQVLRAMTNACPEDFIFKGGTSLFKAHGLIERFSEDIDILVIKGEKSWNAIDKLMKKLADVASTEARGELHPHGEAQKGRHRAYMVGYRITQSETDAIRSSVLLEMGVRGGHQPHEWLPIGSLLADALYGAGVQIDGYEDLSTFNLPVLHPGRTLLEKFSIIHTVALKLQGGALHTADPHVGRHFYDIFKLLGADVVIRLLRDKDQVGRILEEIEEITRSYFEKPGSPVEIRPAEGYAQSPAFGLGSVACTKLQTVYEATMPQLYYGAAPLPAWSEICEKVHRSAHLL